VLQQVAVCLGLFQFNFILSEDVLMDILVSNETGDVVYTNADIPPVTDEQRLDVAQRLRIKLQTYLGEWFLNTETGVPYYERILRKGVRKQDIDVIFQTLIREEPDVLEITEFSSTLSGAREYELSFRVRVAGGTTDQITIEV